MTQDKMRKALEPFARAAEWYDRQQMYLDGDVVVQHEKHQNGMVRIEVGDLRRAREALSTSTGGEVIADRETLQTVHDLINDLHGSLDRQTYDEKMHGDFDLLPEHEYSVMVTARQERDLSKAVCILESRMKNQGGEGVSVPDGWRPHFDYRDKARWPPRDHPLYTFFHDARLGFGEGESNYKSALAYGAMLTAAPPPPVVKDEKVGAQRRDVLPDCMAP